MGLAEKRVAAEFETTVYPGLCKEAQLAAGFKVPIEVRWDTLVKDPAGVNRWKDGWPKIYFRPMVEAFRAICIDEVGKQALRATLTKVIIQNTKDSYSSHWATFTAGVLTLDYMFTNVDAIADRTKTLRETLEKGL